MSDVGDDDILGLFSRLKTVVVNTLIFNYVCDDLLLPPVMHHENGHSIRLPVLPTHLPEFHIRRSFVHVHVVNAEYRHVTFAGREFAVGVILAPTANAVLAP